MRLVLSILLASAAASVHAGECAARSGAHTAALVELYTSEGCSSCPPADRWLQSLGARGYAPGRVVPLSLHVDYWDYIGWKDPFAQARFSARQRQLAKAAGARFVYTPQVLLQGRDFRGWVGGDFEAQVRRINARAPQASIALRIVPGRKDTLEAGVEAVLLDPAHQPDAVLYLATYRSRVVSPVSAGENEGRTLQHDYVVLEWRGPIPFKGGKVAAPRALPLPTGAARADSGVAAFVQNGRTAEVLQALMLPACPS